jgi:glutamate-1-semialdehyde 2,1-aminomutase
MDINSKQASHYHKACELIPGGMQTNFRRLKDYIPLYIDHGLGARLYDLDGKEYIDFLQAFGPAILGYSNQVLKDKLKDQIDRLFIGESNTLEAQAAQLIVDHVPCAEKVRFTCSGSEAASNAFRLARAYTARNMLVRFNGHYHGSLDSNFGGVAIDPNNPIPDSSIEYRDDDIFSQIFSTKGRAAHALNDCYVIEWNDEQALAKLLETHGDQIAAVCMEPINFNSNGCVPRDGYLEAVRNLCDSHGVLLIFDEVITGFRVGLGGAQTYYNVIPDLAILGKALGGGMPVSAFCGKQKIMDLITETEVVVAGTFNGHPLSMAALIATIGELTKDNCEAYSRMERLGLRLAEGVRRCFKKYGLHFILQGAPTCWSLGLSKEGVIHSHDDAIRQGDGFEQVWHFANLLKEQHVISGGRFMLSAAHTEADIEDTLIRCDRACQEFSASQ